MNSVEIVDLVDGDSDEDLGYLASQNEFQDVISASSRLESIWSQTNDGILHSGDPSYDENEDRYYFPEDDDDDDDCASQLSQASTTSSVKSKTSFSQSVSTSLFSSISSTIQQRQQTSQLVSQSQQQQQQIPIPLSQSVSTTIQRPKVSVGAKKKLDKQTDLEIRRQTTGKYKHEEIGIIIGTSYSLKNFPTLLRTCFNAEEGNVGAIFESDCFANNSIRFTYRPKVLGGRANVGDDNVVVLPYAIVLFPADEFIRLAYQSKRLDGSKSETFVELSDSMKETINVLCSLDSCPLTTRVIFILVDIEKEMLNFRRSLNKKEKVSVIDLDDVITYLVHDQELDILPVISVQHACEYVLAWTKIVASYIYKKDSSEFDAKQRCLRLLPEDNMTEQEREISMLREIWISMLQVVPKLSHDKARSLIREGKYTCPMKLLDGYSNEKLSKESKLSMLQNSFTSGTNRTELRLSKQLYNLFIQLDPMYPLDDS